MRAIQIRKVKPVKTWGIAGHSLSADLEIYTAEDLEGLTISQIRSLADKLGYAVTKTKKADIINEFLAEQEGVL